MAVTVKQTKYEERLHRLIAETNEAIAKAWDSGDTDKFMELSADLECFEEELKNHLVDIGVMFCV